MSFFDKNLDRARQLLSYSTERETAKTLVESGMSSEDAFLVVMAAKVIDKDEPKSEEWLNDELPSFPGVALFEAVIVEAPLEDLN